MSILYHDGSRRFQDQFDSRRIADRLEEKLTRTAFTADDTAFIESRILFFLATADAAGRPTCNHKGGAPGFVRVVAPDEACCSSISRSRSGCGSTAARACRATTRCSRTRSAHS